MKTIIDSCRRNVKLSVYLFTNTIFLIKYQADIEIIFGLVHLRSRSWKKILTYEN